MFRMIVAAVVAALTLTGQAAAAGGDYEVVDATPSQATSVHMALDASSFDWGQVKQHIVIRVVPGLANRMDSVPGTIRVRPDTVDDWGGLQHEYAHQLAYFVLTDAQRAELLKLFGLTAWRDGPMEQRGSEHFATMVAVTYWPVAANLLLHSPYAQHDRVAFQRLMASWGLSKPPTVCKTVVVKSGYWHTHRVWVRLPKPHWVPKRHWHKPVTRQVCTP